MDTLQENHVMHIDYTRIMNAKWKTATTASSNFALAELLVLNFLIHGERYPLDSRSSLTPLREEKAPRLCSTIRSQLLRGNCSRYRKKRIAAIAWRIQFMYNKKYSRARGWLLRTKEARGEDGRKRRSRKMRAKLRSGRHTGPLSWK